MGDGAEQSSLRLQQVVDAVKNTVVAINKLSQATRKSIMNIRASSLVGNPTGAAAQLQPISIGTTLIFSGTELRTIAGTGDVTWAADTFTTVITALPLTKLANIADQTILGNNVGSPGPPVALTTSQAQVVMAVVPGTDVEVYGQSTLNTQTGTTYTLVIGDKGKIVEMNNAAANTLTVPPNSSVAFPIGSRIDIVQFGAGATSIAAGAGVTIRSQSSFLKLFSQYAAATLYKRATDEWVLIGNLKA